MRPTIDACRRVLEGNDRGGHTVPSPRLYPHQWAWDSAFAAIGWAYFDSARARRELQTLMDAAWDDGRVPHVVYHDLTGDYAPRPEFWEAERSSTISQPPIWATALRRVVEITGDGDGLAPIVGAMEASHRWFAERRDPQGRGAVSVAHPWESGMDNSPAWDRALARIEVQPGTSFERRDTAVVGDASQRPTDAEYARYAQIVKDIARSGFGHGSFVVYDPFMTAVAVRAEDDLTWLAERAGVQTRAPDRAQRLREGLEGLWHDDWGRYAYVDADGPVPVDVIGSYLPLWCGVSEARTARLRAGLEERFAATLGVPTTAPTDPCFEPRRYWRGPVWINVNWLLADALGDDLVEQTLEAVGRAGCREYYDPRDGAGLGAESFSWTAALAIDLMHR